MPQNDKPASVLIIDDNEDVLALLEALLGREGFRTFSTLNGEEGLSIASREHPDVVLLDLNMPGLKGLEVCRDIKSDPETQNSVVMILSAISDIQIKAQGFHLGAADYIQKPFRHVELLARIEAQLRQKRALDELQAQCHELSERLSENLRRGGEVVDQEAVVSERKTLVFPNDLDRIQGVVNQLLIGIGGRCPKKTITDLALGLHETILNAIEHGNLGISTEDKRRALEENTLDTLIRSRLEDPGLAERRVTIEYELDNEAATFRIRDEGDGFDWRPFTEQDQPEDLLASHGRGIMISRFTFDSMEYNEAGNEVCLTKRLDTLEE